MTGNFRARKISNYVITTENKHKTFKPPNLMLTIKLSELAYNFNKGLPGCQKSKNIIGWHENKVGSKIQTAVRFYQ